MVKTIRHFTFSIGILLLIATIISVQTFAENSTAIKSTITEYTQEEKDFIFATQNQEPLNIGIIPHTFPLSDCPPDATSFTGTNIEMLELISEKSGLRFGYHRIPTEEKTPFECLKSGDFTLVAGTIRLDNFTNNPDLILSNRFCDGSLVCIAKRNTNPKSPKTGKIAVMSGYQAGMEFAKKQFPQYEVELYPNNQDVMKAVRQGKADLTMISRYVGIYELQNPFNEQLEVLAPYQIVLDSCVMGMNSPETQIAISIINKALAEIGEDEYNHVQMNFSITHPYKLTFMEFLFKYRYFFSMAGFAFLTLALLLTKLLYSQKEHSILSRDPLTGALTEAGFELESVKIIPKINKPLFITDFDIRSFSSYNEFNGKEKGDELLKNVVETVGTLLSEQDMICRSYADNFKVLSCNDSVENLIKDIQTANNLFNEFAENKVTFNFGVYPIVDKNIPISKMLDFAAITKKNVKYNSKSFIGVFDKKLHEHNLNNSKMISSFDKALANREFVAYYQPKFDVITKEIVGAEALVRWMYADGTMVPPFEFIELFEKNGQIQRLDFYMLEQVCIFQQNLIQKNMTIVPISVNFSRIHLYSSDFVQKVDHVVEKYDIPKHLIEIECTETAMSYDDELTKDILGKLQAQGFGIAMDDFGKAYSSLNTLCTMPLDIIKLDSGFLVATLENEKVKANKIIQGVVSLVHELSLKIIAEGVETEEQYLFLKSVGCDYIQGYYFSKPLPEQTFFNLLTKDSTSQND